MSAKKDLIWYGLGALGIYLIWTKVSNTLTGPNSAFDATTTWLASLFPGTSPSVTVQGSVTLPGGSVVPMSTLQSNGFNADGSLSVSDQSGNSYNIVSGATPGTYVAQ